MRCSAAFSWRLPRRSSRCTCGPLDASRVRRSSGRSASRPKCRGSPVSARSRAAVIAPGAAGQRGPDLRHQGRQLLRPLRHLRVQPQQPPRQALRRARRARCTGSGSSAGSASTRCAPAGCPSAPTAALTSAPTPAGSPAADSQPRALLHQVGARPPPAAAPWPRLRPPASPAPAERPRRRQGILPVALVPSPAPPPLSRRHPSRHLVHRLTRLL